MDEKTVDVRDLSRGDKEKRIFSSLDAMKPGDRIKVIVEFNPLPLILMLKTKRGFKTSSQKVVSGHWELAIDRVPESREEEGRFRAFLKKLTSGKISGKDKEEAKKLFQTIDASTLGALEQDLIREGVSRDTIRQSLCDIHLEVMKESLVAKQRKVTAPHPVHTLMEEHQVILKYLAELTQVIENLKNASQDRWTVQDLKKLKRIAHQLVEAESHHQREEDVLFPKLEAHDVLEPVEIMKLDHVDLRKKKEELKHAADHFSGSDFKEFQSKAVEAGEFIARELESHIFKEDNILYQMALEVLSEDEWKEIKDGCDRIGYCTFTPEGSR